MDARGPVCVWPVDVVPGARLDVLMIRCRRCEQWFMPGDPRTSTVVIIDGAPTPSCHHFGLRVATADEIAANNRDYERRVLAANDRDDSYVCSRCGKVWRRGGDPDVSCLVMHAPGTCCHYGDTEVILNEAAPPRCGWG